MSLSKNNKALILCACAAGAAALLTTTKPVKDAASTVANGLLPRGIRNNNPGNLRDSGSAWQGKIGVDDKKFVRFSDMDFGIRASVLNMLTAINKHKATSVRKLITRWAPAFENNTAAYISAVAKNTPISADETINVSDKHTVAALMASIFKHENGHSHGINTAKILQVIDKYGIIK
jgi:hypothetical protein